MMRTLTLTLASFLSLASFAQAPTIAWDAPVDCNAPAQGMLRPRIALNASGAPVVLWGASGPARNYVAIGSGTGFTSAMEVSTPGCVPAVADWMGSSIAAVGNTVWVVMKATPEETKPVYARRSDDGGSTWGDTMRVDPFDGLVSRFPTIALSDPDLPVVQYMQFDGGWNGARQVVTHMMGGAFMSPVQISTPYAPGEVCDCCPNQIMVQDNKAVALYRNAGSNIRVIWGATSLDGGMTFPVGNEVDATGWVLNACPSSGPDGYLAGDSVRYVWMSGASNGTKVHIGTALAADLSTGTQRFVMPGEASGVQQNFPRIAGVGDTLGVVWEQYTNGARDIFFSWSVSGVNGLSAAEIVNVDLTGSQRTPDIAYADGAFHIVWGEAGTNQVRYRRAVIQSGVGIDDATASDTHFRFDPTDNSVVLSGGSWTSAEVFDAQGKLVHAATVRNDRVKLRDLPQAIHVLRVRGPGDRIAEWRFFNR
ncbi:MAG: hypothetical protein IPP83_12940 [Flavobacteriales bacterium]|nr:hypothetical protein [Flavobacteriales bacterium]